MYSMRNIFLGLAAAACAAAVSPPIQAQSNGVDLHLNYGSGSTCEFSTDNNGISFDLANGAASAHGTFGGGCPSGSTGAASFVDGLEGDVGPTTTAGTPFSLTWKADADLCTYDNSSLPVGVANWPVDNAYACFGEGQCNTAHTASITPTYPGSYTFELTCLRAGSTAAPVVSSVTTQVQGGGGGGGSCVAPAGLTRQSQGDVDDARGSAWLRNIDLTSFDNVFSVLFPATFPTTTWPGVAAGQATPVVNRDQYIALQFTVPVNYSPVYTGGYPGTGLFTIVNTATQGGTKTMTISPDCGDFTASHFTGALAPCRGQAASESPILAWAAVNNVGAAMGLCPLVRGQTYYLNLVVAPENDVTTSSCNNSSNGSPRSTCKVNIKNTFVR